VVAAQPGPVRHRAAVRLAGVLPRRPAARAAGARRAGAVGDFLQGAYSRLSERFWGGLEINYVGPDTFPHWWTNLLVVAVCAAVAAALVGAGRSRLPLLVSVLVPFVSTVGIVGYGIWGGYSYSLDFPGAQGRYLFGSLPSMAVAVALGLVVLPRAARRAGPAAAAVLALGMQAAGLYSVLARSWLPVYDGRGRLARYRDALDGVVDHSPWPDAVPPAVFVLTGLAAVAVLVVAVRLALVRDEQPTAVRV
jgi:hypothetical protein